MDAFSSFATIVARSFQDMAASNSSNNTTTLLISGVDSDELWSRYLGAFPPGTDPLFRKRTWHDCNCCKQFVRRVGSVISVAMVVDATASSTGGGGGMSVRTVWDEASETPSLEHYAFVAGVLRELIVGSPVKDVFKVAKNELRFGARVSHSLDPETQNAVTWEHFYSDEIPDRFRISSPTTSVEAEKGEHRTAMSVLERGLTELAPDAVDTVISLIGSNSLYRGEEHSKAVNEFRRLQRNFLALKDGRERSLFVWANAASPGSRFRNTVIGTLVQDLSSGVDLERAVSSFEGKVAPQNYKRSSSLITPQMVKRAMETITSLGLEPVLERRLAVLSDVSVGDVLWVDGSVRPRMKHSAPNSGGIGGILLAHAEGASGAPGSNNLGKNDESRAEDVSIDELISRILPEVTGMEILFKSSLQGNLMTLTAPVHPEPQKQLFRWNNDFSWSYTGNVADSAIKQRVKKAGGSVAGILRVSLSWYNFDDLDVRVYQPNRTRGVGLGELIYFRSKHGWSGGTLDVDMNAGRGTTREPVENITWPEGSSVPDGPYRVTVHNYAHREMTNPGFTLELENNGQLTHLSYPRMVRNDQEVHVCTVHMKGNVIDRLEPGESGVTSSSISQEKWGLQTERLARVTSVMLSPNHWGGSSVGNKHTFFILDGARTDEDTRGFYNEFLHPRLEQHRKVFEVIADRMKCSPVVGDDGVQQQLSGLGFSSTKPDNFLVRAVMQGNKSPRIFRVRVGG